MIQRTTSHQQLRGSKRYCTRNRFSSVTKHPSPHPERKGARAVILLHCIVTRILHVCHHRLEVGGTHRRAQDVQQFRDDNVLKLGQCARIQEVQELIAPRAPGDRHTLESVAQEIDHVRETGRRLREVLSSCVADVGDGNAGVAELVHQRVRVGDGGNLIEHRLVDEERHGRGTVQAHLRVRAEVFRDGRLGDDVVAVVEVLGHVLQSEQYHIAVEAVDAALVELRRGRGDQLFVQRCFKVRESPGHADEAGAGDSGEGSVVDGLIYVLQSEGFKSAWCLRHHLGFYPLVVLLYVPLGRFDWHIHDVPNRCRQSRAFRSHQAYGRA
jgi:hypothetical protein